MIKKIDKVKNKKNNNLINKLEKPLQHHYVTRAFLIILAIVIFTFNSLAKVDIGAQDVKTAINQENLLMAHNKIRSDNGLGELSLNYLLSKSAQAKADQMMQSNCWSHYCPNGRSPWAFFDDVNYNYVFAGENLAEGFYNIEDLMNAWIKSPTHKANIIKKEFTEVGFGISYGNFQNHQNNILVVAHFGTRSPNVTLSSDQKKIEITNPKTGDTLVEPVTSIQGNISGVNEVDIVLNNEDKGQAQINNGIFTFRLNSLQAGKNEIFAKGYTDDNVVITSNTIQIFTNSQVKGITTEIKTNGLSFNISPQSKNLINLGFVVFLAVFFFVDFLIFKRIHALKALKSYSHYHFVLFIIVALIIIIGGFGGHVAGGLQI